MRSELVSGFCDPRFSEIERQFSEGLESGFETGASVAIEHHGEMVVNLWGGYCLLYTSPSPRDLSTSRMPSSA